MAIRREEESACTAVGAPSPLALTALPQKADREYSLATMGSQCYDPHLDFFNACYGCFHIWYFHCSLAKSEWQVAIGFQKKAVTYAEISNKFVAQWRFAATEEKLYGIVGAKH